MSPDVDLAILGGGLAGLTLALQAQRALPAARVVVLERTRRPLPEACHKVGESAVEMGSHYFGQVLGLASYLEDEHLFKNGLRFFCGDGELPVHERTEIGPVEFPIVHSYQMDRGRYENDLRAMVEEAGVTLIEGVFVRDITITPGDAPNALTYKDADGTLKALSARWITDATGRGRRIQKQLGLRIPADKVAHAAWFRVKGKLGPADLVGRQDTEPSDDPSATTKDARTWLARDVDDNRWLSTSHFMGPGYWVWLIPLSTGHTSVGVVIEDQPHALSDLNREASMRAWLARFEPAIATALEGRVFEDFRQYHRYPYRISKSLSADGWSAVGEASLFVDPLYSMGNDFIALGNTLTTRLVGERLAGTLDEALVDELDLFYRHWALDMDRTLSGNGKIFGHARIFGAKLWWDFALYWSFHCPYFFDGGYEAELEEHRAFHALRGSWAALNRRAQAILEAWAEHADTETSVGPAFIPLPMFPSVLVDLHLELQNDHSREESRARMESNLEMGRELVGELLAHALLSLPTPSLPAFGRDVARDGQPTELSVGRIAADAKRRRERLQEMTPIARDLERALGRSRPDDGATLRQRFEAAFGANDAPASRVASA